MRRNSFVLYTDQKETIEELTDEEAGKIFKALYEYNENEQINLTGVLKAIFMQFKIFLDKDNAKWEETKKKKSEAGRLGGIQRAINNNQALSSKSKQCLDVLSKSKQDQANQAVNVNVNDNVNINKKENIKRKNFFGNKDLNSIFIEFLEIRKKLKAVNSDRAINTIINKLSKYDDATKYKMIEQSIVNSWKNVYELKEKNNAKQVPKWMNDETLNKKEDEEELTDEERRIYDKLAKSGGK